MVEISSRNIFDEMNTSIIPENRKEIRETKKHFWIFLNASLIKFKKRRTSYICDKFASECECKCLANDRADFKVVSISSFDIPNSSFIVNEKFSSSISTFRFSADGSSSIDANCENLYLNCNNLHKSPTREIYIIHEDTIYNRNTAWNNLV